MLISLFRAGREFGWTKQWPVNQVEINRKKKEALRDISDYTEQVKSYQFWGKGRFIVKDLVAC